MDEQQAQFEGEIESVEIGADEAGGRLDRVLAARVTALSRTRIKALVLRHFGISAAKSGPRQGAGGPDRS